MPKRKKTPKRSAVKAPVRSRSRQLPVSKPRLAAGRPSRVKAIQPAKWFRDSVHRGWANDTQAIEYARRQSEVDYLRESIKLLRKFYKGYGAQDGYSIQTREIVRLDAKRLAEIKTRGAQLRKEMSADFRIARPRSSRSKEALYKHTGASRSKKRKAFVVHTPDKNTEIKIDYPRDKKAQVHVKEIKKRTGAESKRVYYYFADFADEQPTTIEDIIDLTRDEMLPKMKKGYYVFVSADYGYIAAPMYKDLLLKELSSQWLDYDRFSSGVSLKDNRGLAENLIGYALVSTKLEGAEYEYRERQTRRVAYRKYKAQLREQKRQRIRARTTPRCTFSTKNGKRCKLARGHDGKHRM
jgi:hypothetical protein